MVYVYLICEMAFKYLMLYIDAHTFFLSPCVQYYSHFTVGNLLHPIDVQIDHVCPEVFNCIDLWPNKDVMWLIKSPIRYYYTQRSLNSAKSAICVIGNLLIHHFRIYLRIFPLVAINRPWYFSTFRALGITAWSFVYSYIRSRPMVRTRNVRFHEFNPSQTKWYRWRSLCTEEWERYENGIRPLQKKINNMRAKLPKSNNV